MYLINSHDERHLQQGKTAMAARAIPSRLTMRKLAFFQVLVASK